MTVLAELVFPERVLPTLQARLDALFADTASWVQQPLAGTPGASDRARMATSLSEIETLRIHAGYETPALQAAAPLFVLLQRRMQMLIPILAGIEDRPPGLGRAGLEPIRPVL